MLNQEIEGNETSEKTAAKITASPALSGQAADILSGPCGTKEIPGNQTPVRELPVVLITGFEPFGGEKINPSWEAASRLNGQIIDGARIVARELPVEYGRADDALAQDIKETHPALVVLVGEAGGSSSMAIENKAVNLDDSGPDNAGVARYNTPILKGSPETYNSTLPVADTVRALQKAGINATESQSAGNFLCNHEFYLLEDYIAKSAPDLHGGFVHVPYLPEQVTNEPGTASMPLKTEIAGLKIVIATGLDAQTKSSSVAV